MTFLKKTVLAAALLVTSAVAAAAFPAVATNSVTVRAGPGNNYPPVDRLYPGERVDVVGRSGSWYEIAGAGWARAGSFDALGRSYSYAPGYYGYGPGYGYRSGYDHWDSPSRGHQQSRNRGNYNGGKQGYSPSRIGSGAPGQWRPGAGGSSR
jgi:hypothetical protein